MKYFWLVFGYLILALLIITFVPWFSLALPNLMFWSESSVG